MKNNLSLIILFVIAISSSAQNLPAGYWPPEKSQSIINKTQTTYLTPSLSSLSQEEILAIQKLNEVGKIFQSLYEYQRHPKALSSLKELQSLDKKLNSHIATQNLLTLYRLYQGPIANTLENKREAFLTVKNELPGGSLYPEDETRGELGPPADSD